MAYLETSGVRSIADIWARTSRTRSLLQQAFDEDMGTWVMRQTWYRDPSINNDAVRVLERIRAKIEQEADPRNALAALMRRKWNPGESVDSFWLDIQTQVQYCGLRDEYHTDLILTTVWSNNFGDDETRKEFALNPKWSAVECYQRAKGLEQVRKERKGEFSVNAVRQSAYKQGGGKNAAKGAGKSTGGNVNSGGKTAFGQKSGVGGSRGTSRSASCLTADTIPIATGFAQPRGRSARPVAQSATMPGTAQPGESTRSRRSSFASATPSGSRTRPSRRTTTSASHLRPEARRVRVATGRRPNSRSATGAKSGTATSGSLERSPAPTCWPTGLGFVRS
jgi:hypothetical protein